MNWELGFKRLGNAFIGFCWLVFVAANWTASPAQWGEYSVYMLLFTVAMILFGRVVRWIIRGFLDRGGAA